jgi:predicted peroxiredoxin
MSETKEYVVMIVNGIEDGGWRATIGFSFIETLLAFDHKVYVFFTGNGVTWCLKDSPNIKIEPFTPALKQVENFIESPHVEMLLCSTCIGSCAVSNPPPIVKEGITITGMGSLVPHLSNGNMIVF